MNRVGVEATVAWSPVGRISPAAAARLAPVCEALAGRVLQVEPLAGGCVSHVFRVFGTVDTVVLKVRTARFARIPWLDTDPALIGLERQALELLGSAAGGFFPEVLHHDPVASAMVLTDIFPDRRNYEDHLLERPSTVAEMHRLGTALRTIHAATRDFTAPLRVGGDDAFRDLTLGLCVEHGHPVLADVASRLRAAGGTQLILGDPAPKNMSLAGDGVAICDLDNVHLGTPSYDLGYVAGHVLLHHVQHIGRGAGLVAELLRSYLAGGRWGAEQEEIVTAVAAGAILYRLRNRDVPYRLTITEAERSAVAAAVWGALSGQPLLLAGLIDHAENALRA